MIVISINSPNTSEFTHPCFFFNKLYFAHQLHTNNSLFMCPESDDLQTLIIKYRTMDIEELEANIDNWKKENNCSTELQSLGIAKSELELKYKERQEQIELLTKSLTSSSRVGRWISSAKSALKQLLKFKN